MKRRGDLIAELDELARKRDILLARQENLPKATTRLFWGFVWIFVTIALASDLKFNFVLMWTGMATAFVGFIKISSKHTTKHELDELQKQELEKSEELEKIGRESIEKVQLTKDAHEMITIEISPLCNIWDKWTGGYMYNPASLVCPKCKSHNGLLDPKIYKNEPYECPNCKKMVNHDVNVTMYNKEK